MLKTAKKNIVKKSKVGRPLTTSSQKDLLLKLIGTTSKGLETIYQENKGKVPSPSTVMEYLAKDKEFSDRYARAREDQAEIIADEMISIADNCTDDVTILKVLDDQPGKEVINHSAINRAKLQIETRKWIISKLKPKKYGAQVDLTSGGDKLTFNVNVTDD